MNLCERLLEFSSFVVQIGKVENWLKEEVSRLGRLHEIILGLLNIAFSEL